MEKEVASQIREMGQQIDVMKNDVADMINSKNAEVKFQMSSDLNDIKQDILSEISKALKGTNWDTAESTTSPALEKWVNSNNSTFNKIYMNIMEISKLSSLIFI